MAWYYYECVDCRKKAEEIKGGPLDSDEEWEIIYETAHPMQPTEKQLAAALICPRCNGGNAVKSYKDCNVVCYIRGDGYLDKSGCHRDMNLHKLTTDDPYASMRESGEADDLKIRLQRAGNHNPRPKYFPPSKTTDKTDE